MTPRQVVGVAERAVRERALPHLPVDLDRRYDQRVPEHLPVRTTPIERNTSLLRDCLAEERRDRHRARARSASDGVFTFMNRSLPIARNSSINWYDDRLDDLPRLWRLKLYGFEPLSWIVLGVDPGDPAAEPLQETADQWLRDWLDSVEIGGPRYLRRTWTPYAVSLRLINWIRYAAWRDARTSSTEATTREGGGIPSEIRREIFRNAAFLHDHVERDVGGNHLIENGAALVAGGRFFDDDPQDWTETGLSVLTRASDRQFLEDGCHFERSPMYHIRATTRYSTVCDVLDRTGRSPPDAIRETVRDCVAFLAFLRPPNGRMPLLNDSVHDEAVSLEASLRYARAIDSAGPGRIEGPPPPRRADGEGVAPPTSPSGYRWLDTDRGAMLIDGGPVGPPHLPGHAHCDLLSVLLWIDGRAILTDTGTADYEAGPRRRYARGVAGHNTIQVGDLEPTAIGGRFLMGPRPSPTVRVTRGETDLVEGRYTARPFDGPRYDHHRAAFAGDRWWLIDDQVSGHGGRPVRHRLHLHPDWSASVSCDGDVRLSADDGGSSAVSPKITPIGATTVEVTDGWYFPRFGETHKREVIEIRSEADHSRPVRVGTVISPDDHHDQLDGMSPEELTTAVVGDGSAGDLPSLHLR